MQMLGRFDPAIGGVPETVTYYDGRGLSRFVARREDYRLAAIATASRDV